MSPLWTTKGFLLLQHFLSGSWHQVGKSLPLAPLCLLPTHWVTQIWGWSRQRGHLRHFGSHQGAGIQDEAIRNCRHPWQGHGDLEEVFVGPCSQQRRRHQAGHVGLGTAPIKTALTHFLLTLTQHQLHSFPQLSPCPPRFCAAIVLDFYPFLPAPCHQHVTPPPPPMIS